MGASIQILKLIYNDKISLQNRDNIKQYVNILFIWPTILVVNTSQVVSMWRHAEKLPQNPSQEKDHFRANTFFKLPVPVEWDNRGKSAAFLQDAALFVSVERAQWIYKWIRMWWAIQIKMGMDI